MSEINLGEVYYQTIRKIGLEPAREFIERLSQFPFEIIAPSSAIIMKASEIKAQYAISYADCFAVATANSNTCSSGTDLPASPASWVVNTS